MLNHLKYEYLQNIKLISKIKLKIKEDEKRIKELVDRNHLINEKFLIIERRKER